MNSASVGRQTVMDRLEHWSCCTYLSSPRLIDKIQRGCVDECLNQIVRKELKLSGGVRRGWGEGIPRVFKPAVPVDRSSHPATAATVPNTEYSPVVEMRFFLGVHLTVL